MHHAKILVIDDETKLTLMVRLLLEKIGPFQVREVNHSPDAVAAALAFQPDLVVLDISMPEMDGGEVAQALQALPALRGTSILFYSAWVSSGTASAHGVMPGGHRCLAKPASAGLLVKTVQALLTERFGSIKRCRA